MKITKGMFSVSYLSFCDININVIFDAKEYILAQDTPSLPIPTLAQIELLIELMPKQSQRLFAIDCYNTLPRPCTYRQSDKAVLIARAHTFGTVSDNELIHIKDICRLEADGLGALIAGTSPKEVANIMAAIYPDDEIIMKNRLDRAIRWLTDPDELIYGHALKNAEFERLWSQYQSRALTKQDDTPFEQILEHVYISCLHAEICKQMPISI